MIDCKKHGEQVIGFVSTKLREAILNDLEPHGKEVLLIAVRDIPMPMLDWYYQGWPQDHEFLIARNKQSNIMHLDELNELNVPICPKCKQEYVQKYSLIEKSTDEIHFSFIDR